MIGTPLLTLLPEKTGRRLAKVCVRTIHLVGTAGVFGGAMMHSAEPLYLNLAIISGIVLVVMEASSGWIWFVQLRAVAVYIKLLLLMFIHLYPGTSIPGLIAVIAISGFMSHAPRWIRYFSLLHGAVIHSDNDLLG